MERPKVRRLSNDGMNRRTPSGLRPVAKRDLTKARLVAQTVQTIQRDGVAKVSLNRLAAELGVTGPAIYHHVPNRQALLDLAADEIVAGIHVPSSDLPWTERLRELILEIDRVMRAHPGVYRVVLEGATQARLRLIELRLSVLWDAGFRGNALVDAFSAVAFHVNPYALLDVPPNAETLDTAGATVRELVENSDLSLPVTRAILTELTEISFNDHYAHGLDRLIASLKPSAQEQASSAQRARGMRRSG